MTREKVLLKSEKRTSTDDVADFLRDLAEKVRSGSVTLKQGGSEVVLDLPQSVTLELKVEEEEGRSKTQKSLEVEIEWYEGEEMVDDVELV